MPSAVDEQTLTVEIDHLGARGDGVAATADGPVFVPYTLPGETVRTLRSGERGQLIEMIEPSPDRIAPGCRHFTVCGGCAVQHMSQPAYLDWKRAQVRMAFASRGIDAAVGEVIGVPTGARRRATFSAKRSGAGIVLGFHAARTHDLVDLAECPVLSPRIVRALGPLRDLVEPLLSRTGEVRVSVMDAANGLDVAIEDTAKELGAAMRATLAASAIRAGILRLTVGGEAVYINAEPVVAMGRAGVTPPPGAFLQASSKGEQAMVEILTAAIGKAKRVVDLFCGLGAFTFPLAGTSAVLAVDGDRRAIDALVKAANHTQGLKRIETKVRDLLREPLSPKELETFDAAVFDPPRAGASSQAERLAKSKLKTVVAVSCNPATLARDARILIDGGYRLESITPIDQFLFSPHIEAVAVFRR